MFPIKWGILCRISSQFRMTGLAFTNAYLERTFSHLMNEFFLPKMHILNAATGTIAEEEKKIRATAPTINRIFCHVLLPVNVNVQWHRTTESGERATISHFLRRPNRKQVNPLTSPQFPAI